MITKRRKDDPSTWEAKPQSNPLDLAGILSHQDTNGSFDVSYFTGLTELFSVISSIPKEIADLTETDDEK